MHDLPLFETKQVKLNGRSLSIPVFQEPHEPGSGNDVFDVRYLYEYQNHKGDWKLRYGGSWRTKEHAVRQLRRSLATCTEPTRNPQIRATWVAGYI